MEAEVLPRLVKSESSKGRKHVGYEVFYVTLWHRSLAWSWLLCMPGRKSLLATLTCSFLDSLFGQLHSTQALPFLEVFLDARHPFYRGAKIRNYNGFFRDFLDILISHTSIRFMLYSSV